MKYIELKKHLNFLKKLLTKYPLSVIILFVDAISEHAGIGRQARLRGVCLWRVGSSPTARTSAALNDCLFSASFFAYLMWNVFHLICGCGGIGSVELDRVRWTKKGKRNGAAVDRWRCNTLQKADVGHRKSHAEARLPDKKVNMRVWRNWQTR